MPTIKFGTDGWRAVISEDFTFENVRIVSQAVADYYNQKKKGPHLVVGYDTRFLSSQYAETISRVFAANGIKVILSDRYIPTPIVSYTIKDKKLDGGIMVTASHNPPQFNGIKIKAHYAGSADPSITAEVENKLYQNKVKIISKDEALNSHLLEISDITPNYLKFVRSYLDLSLFKKTKYKILHDVMYGTGNGYVNKILEGTPNKTTIFRGEANPLFGGINPEPIPANLKATVEEMKKGKYDLAIVTDGDADRIALVRPDGRIILPGEILCLILLHFIEDKKWSGAVVKTISNTMLINKIAKKYNLKLYETPVGFKYIAQLMLKEDILIGGEESGGIGVKNYIPERDGALLGLLVLEMMAWRKKSIIKIMDEVEKEFGHFWYLREDVKYPLDKKEKLIPFLKEHPLTKLADSPIKEIKDYDGIKFINQRGNWLLFRFSGTEPILRIYAEADSQARVKEVLSAGKKLVFSF